MAVITLAASQRRVSRKDRKARKGNATQMACESGAILARDSRLIDLKRVFFASFAIFARGGLFGVRFHPSNAVLA